MIDLLQVLQSAGVKVVEEGDWRRRGRAGAFSPIGVMNHHTASAGSALKTCIEGRSDLAGPLCHLYLDKAGVFHLIAAGRANHAGKGSGSVLARVKASQPPGAPGPDDTDGNAYFYGIEVENNGIGEPYPPAQIDALIKANAAIDKALGVNEHHDIHHKEWTKRKVDMSWGGDLRGLVAKQLNPPPAPSKPPVLAPPKHFPGDNMIRREYHVNQLDSIGNGWISLAGIDYQRVVSVYCHGSYPPVDGYWPIPKFGLQARGKDTIVEITGGKPNQSGFEVVVWITD